MAAEVLMFQDLQFDRLHHGLFLCVSVSFTPHKLASLSIGGSRNLEFLFLKQAVNKAARESK